MERVKIGITTYGRNEKNQFYLPAEYVDAVRRAGGVAYLLVPGDNDAARQLLHLDGLIITGGGDIHPDYCKAAFHETNYLVDLERDRSEFEIVKYALHKKMPMLAICRGMQVVNIIEGGTLYVHLPEQIKEVIPHRKLTYEPITHTVKIQSDSHLATIIGENSLSVMSWHHQAICELPTTLRATAFAEDQVIEAIEMPGHPWMIGVQWHPELSAKRDPLQQKLFNEFVMFCKKNTWK